MSKECDVLFREEATIVIPQRNLGALTLACVESFRRWEGCGWPIVAVDDGSTDDSARLLRDAKFPELHVVEQPSRGVTAAWNAGVRATSTRFVVLLNNDMQVNGPFLESLLRPLRENRALISGATWRVEPDCPRRFLQWLPARKLVAGWCFAFAKELWSRLGEFDETLRLYFSDTDFQCRAVEFQGDQGVPLWVAPGLPIVHLGHRTTRHEPRRAEQWQADRDRFLKKWDDG